MLGVDPGHRKCGLAVVAADGQVVAAAVVAREDLLATVRQWLAAHPVTQLVVGDGTCSGAVIAELQERFPAAPLACVDEHGTTLAARDRYWRDHPPRGFWRLIPTSMRLPPEPYDDVVAVLLAERWWAAHSGPPPVVEH